MDLEASSPKRSARRGGAVGKRVGGFLYLHRSARPSLPEKDKAALELAEKLAPDVDWNVSKTSVDRVSLLLYEDFSRHAFPALLHAATIGLKNGDVVRTDYTERDNPPILHRKELLLPEGDPAIPAFAAITRLAEERSLFVDTKKIGTRRAWQNLVEAAGLRIDGPALLPADTRLAVVMREKTAIPRTSLSAPVSAMIESGMLTAADEFFDYGCGLGDDVAALQAEGYAAWGWDPAHRPDGRRAAADVVNLGFVINVIENPHEREETLRAAWAFARKGIVVSAMLSGKVDVSRQTPHGDGYLTSRSTFQRYYAQDELMQFVGRTLGERAVALGQGVVAVFRDKELEQRVTMRRRSRAASVMRRQSLPRPPKRLREGPSVRPALVERIEAELAAIWDASLSLARRPSSDELGPDVAASLTGKNVSLSRALRALSSRYDLDLLDELAAARRDDLLVETALAMFPGAPRYAALPASMQRDVRHFFGSHAALTAQATTELSILRNALSLQQAYEKAASDGTATLGGGVLRFSSKSSVRLPVPIRIMLGCADILRPGFSDADVFEVGPKPGALKARTVSDMDAPLPLVVGVVNVDLGRTSAWERTPKGEVLFLKSRYLPSDDEGLQKQKAVDDRLLASGVVAEDGKGPDASTLSAMLARRPRTS